MNWNMFSLLGVLLACPLVLAGGSVPSSEAPWLGREVRTQTPSFCQRYGCVQTAARQNTEGDMGWHDGQQVTYRLRNGARLELDVRLADTLPGRGRWISNARLSLPERDKAPKAGDLRLAAEFYRTFTGRQFRTEGVSACLRRSSADPDLEGGNALLSNWTTLAGLPYRARCNVHTGMFWVGWMQQ
jgi:hypothetical protein